MILAARDCWARLRKEPALSTTKDVPSIESGLHVAAGSVRYALGSELEPRLLIPLAAGEAFPEIDAPALSVRDTVLNVGGAVRFLDLTCRNPNVERVFGRICEDAIARMGEGAPAAAALVDVIREARELLLRGEVADVPLEKALGLCGELLVLNQLLRLRPDAWRGWTGPTPAARHDFRADLRAIEVKTGLRGSGRSVEISAIDQLQEPEGGQLHLTHVLLERDGSGPIHVEVLASDAIARASDPGAVRARLALAGYVEGDGGWDEFRFSLLHQVLYRVVEGFPRLVPADFHVIEPPAGVSRFRYRLDLGHAEAFRLADADRPQVFSEFCACLD